VHRRHPTLKDVPQSSLHSRRHVEPVRNTPGDERGVGDRIADDL
jgi:hypothetical protein